jgi:hypothetical protein
MNFDVTTNPVTRKLKLSDIKPGDLFQIKDLRNERGFGPEIFLLITTRYLGAIRCFDFRNKKEVSLLSDESECEYRIVDTEPVKIAGYSYMI